MHVPRVRTIIGTLTVAALYGGLALTVGGCTPDEQRFIATATVTSVTPETIGGGMSEVVAVTVTGVGVTNSEHTTARVHVSAIGSACGGTAQADTFVSITDVRKSSFDTPQWAGSTTVTLHTEMSCRMSATVTKLI